MSEEDPTASSHSYLELRKRGIKAGMFVGERVTDAGLLQVIVIRGRCVEDLNQEFNERKHNFSNG
jgi:hypothetical protein